MMAIHVMMIMLEGAKDDSGMEDEQEKMVIG